MNLTDRKMLFFDIDGTLITDDGNRTCPESAQKAIRLAREKGHLAYINTGRVKVNVNSFLRGIGFDGYVCGCGTYVESEGELLLHHKTDRARCVEIAGKCREFGLMCIFEHAEKTCFDPETPGEMHRNILEHFLAMGRKVVDSIDSPEFSFDKFAAWYSEDNPHLQEFVDFVSEDFSCIFQEGSFMEVVPKGFTKATGIQILLDRYRIPLENVYVFGDSNNDLDMLSFAPHSIAMGECTPEVAAIASYRTDTVLNDGIEKALKHFEII